MYTHIHIYTYAHVYNDKCRLEYSPPQKLLKVFASGLLCFLKKYPSYEKKTKCSCIVDPLSDTGHSMSI